MDLRTQLMHFEGLRLEAYLDTEGIPTIGYGHTGPEVHLGLRWTVHLCVEALDADIEEAEALCRSNFDWYERLNEPRQASIAGMMFQMGPNRLLGFKRMLAAVRDERWPTAEVEALDSKWAKQTPRRARKVARQLSTGEWEA